MSQQPRPNILIIVCENIAWGDLSIHGNPHVKTPHIDSIAERGTQLQRFYSGPVSPLSRAAMLTGRYAYRTRVVDRWCGRSMIDPEEITIASVLADAGYATGYVGKWHLGDCFPMRPQDMGFGEVLTHRGGELCDPSNPRFFDGDCTHFNPELVLNGRRHRFEGYATDIFAEHGIAFLEKHKEKPFFLFASLAAPHTAEAGEEGWSKKFIEAGLEPNCARFYGMVENVDYNVGRILAKLDELDIGDETMVILTSDCGSDLGFDRFNEPFRGRAGSPYEGGIRVPLFIRWRDNIAPETGTRRITHAIDLFPTLCEITGAPADEAMLGVDGRSILPILKGADPNWEDRLIFSQWHPGNTPEAERNYAVVGQDWKLCSAAESDSDIGCELYDLKADPEEEKDQAEDHPEIVQRMRLAYLSWFKDVSTTRDDNFDPPRIVIGSSDEPNAILTRNDWRISGGEDGWTAKTPGVWKIRNVSVRPFEIEVHMDPIKKKRKLIIRVSIGSSANTIILDRVVMPGMKSVTFNSVYLPEGTSNLRAHATMEDGTEEAARYLIFRRL